MEKKQTHILTTKNIISFVLVFVLVVPFGFSFPTPAQAANTQIRQEINITDAYYYATNNAYATSSEIVAITDNSYTSPYYYFEVVASTTAATTASVSLVNATSSAIVKTISITGGNTYQRYRSTSFLPNASTTVEYKVVLNNENIGKGIISSRIVVLQNAATLTKTETQIEIGNNETYTNTATSTFASPKYWYYDSTKWDGSPTFYAEVTYAARSTFASSTTYSTAGTFNVVIPSGVASTSIQLWGGGGSGGGVNATNCTGSGGAGGQYAKSRIADLGGTSKQLFIGAAVTGTSGANGSIGATTTWDGGVVKAGGGYLGIVDAGGGGVGSTVGGVGDVVNAGGNGGAGACAEGSSGGGGEGAGSTGTGGSATGTSGVTGGTGTDGGNGANGLTSTVGTGNTGSDPGGGGSGGRTTNTANRTGGTGGLGSAIITNDIYATTTISVEMSDGSGDGFVNWTPVAQIVKQSDYSVSTSTRIRSASFSPTSGRNYRIAFREGYNGATHAIYNAKIVITQTGTPTKIQPQYLLANTKFANNTSLQKFLNYWDPAEWSTTNAYIFQAETANGSASVVGLNAAEGTQIAGSFLSSPDNRATSTALCMPYMGDLDTQATLNNNDVYASRILVDVGGTPNSCGVSSGTRKIRLNVARLRSVRLR